MADFSFYEDSQNLGS